MKKRNIMFSLMVVVVFLIIQICHYKYNLKLFRQPPSNEWSKAIKVGEGTIKDVPKLIRCDNKIIVAYDDNESLHATIVNKDGKLLKSNTYKVNEELIKSTMLLKSKDGYNICYISTDKGQGYMEKLTVDGDLNKVKSERIQGVNYVYQVSDSTYLMVKDGEIQLVDEEKDKIIDKIKVESVDLMSACKTDNGMVITYMSDNNSLNYINIEDGKIKESKLITNLKKSQKISFSNITCSTYKSNVYIEVEQKESGVFSCVRLFSYNPYNKEPLQETVLYVEGTKEVFYNVGVQGKEGGKFYGVINRTFGKKYNQDDVVEYTVKDNNIIFNNYVTRTESGAILPNNNGQYTVFAAYNDNSKFDIMLCSSSDDFKKVNNVPRKSEASLSFTYLLQGILYSMVHVLTYGLSWIVPTLVLAAILSFLQFKMSDKKKKISFGILALVSIVIKNYSIYKMIYKARLGYIPGIMANPLVGLGIITLIGVMIYFISYKKFTDDLEGMVLIRIMLALLIDSAISLSVFIPFIY